MTAAGSARTTQLLLIRHGETAWNAEGRIQGQLDVPLSQRGLWQAARLAVALADEALDLIIASDLVRATLTAEPLASARGLPVLPEPRLRERHYGRFQGLSLNEIEVCWPQEFAAWRARDPAWAMPDGESGAQFTGRVLRALEDIALRHAGARIAIVAHGGVLDVAYRHAYGLDWHVPRAHTIHNAAINRLHAQAPPLALKIDRWGDVDHLGPGDEDAAP